MIRKPLMDSSTPKTKVFDIFSPTFFCRTDLQQKNVGRKNIRELHLRLSAYALPD
jgi:hypothetical protein